MTAGQNQNTGGDWLQSRCVLLLHLQEASVILSLVRGLLIGILMRVYQTVDGIICSMGSSPAINIIDTIDYVQGIGNGPINPLHPCPKPNTFST